MPRVSETRQEVKPLNAQISELCIDIYSEERRKKKNMTLSFIYDGTMSLDGDSTLIK